MVTTWRAAARTARVALALAALALWSGQAGTQPDEPAVRPATPLSELQLDEGRRWPTDEPVRAAMGTLRDAVEAALYSPDDDCDWVASRIRDEVEWIRQETRIRGPARRQLEIILVELLDAAGEMESRTVLERYDGLSRAAEAVDAYGRLFEHPGWKGLSLRGEGKLPSGSVSLAEGPVAKNPSEGDTLLRR